MSREVNEHGVTFWNEGEDFTEWEWEDCDAAEAAEVVLEDIGRTISLDIGVEEGAPRIEAWMFNCNVHFTFPLLAAVAGWIDERADRQTRRIDYDEGLEEAGHMIAGLEQALALLRVAVGSQAACLQQVRTP